MSTSLFQKSARCTAAASAILLFAVTASAQQANEPGNFDPTTSTSQPASRPARAARNAAPRVTAHSPRDDKGAFSPTDFAKANPALPTLVIAGDSTAAPGDPAHRGWGAVLVDFFDTSKVNIINRAVGGRSFRTFYGEGKWQQIVDALKPGDFVIIEFGHNDGGPPTPANRGDVAGVGDETVDVTKANGTTENVHSFGWYLRTYIHDVRQKGATPLVSTTTVRNIWRDGKVERVMGKVADWDKQVAAEEKVPVIEHSYATADLYEQMGPEAVAKLFPADHTHTSTEGALINAKTLIAGLKAIPDLALVQDLNEAGAAVEAYKPAATTQGK